MKTLNLVDLDKSDIKYQKIKFPDGQQSIVIDEKTLDYENIKEITIKSRLNNFLDLELIICTVKALNTWGIFVPMHLYVPYILGSRSDRAFEVYSPNYLRDVICPIINSLKFKSVTCIDPHSDVLEACINRFRKLDNLGILQFAQFNIYERMSKEELHSKYILVSSDAGASKKIYKLAEQIGYKGDIITCSKDRDINGKLTKTVVPLETNKLSGTIIENRTKDYIIIDDICDGGATFINIAKQLKNQFVTGKIYLIVTHGIFSKGLGELQQYFDGIYTTNSYKQLNPDTQDFVKQLNVY